LDAVATVFVKRKFVDLRLEVWGQRHRP